MHMNPVLQFAIDNQNRTRALLLFMGMVGDEVDDAGQEVLLRLCRANPQDVDSPERYWVRVVRSVVQRWRRRLARKLTATPLIENMDVAQAQDMAAAFELREEIAAALAQATAAERGALMRRLTRPGEMACDRVRIHRFRRRLQGAPA